MSDLIEKKQTLLRIEVIEAKFDAEDFMMYMGTVKGQGEAIDLDNWSIDELKLVIKSYKQKVELNSQSLKEQKQMKQLKKSKLVEVSKKQKVKYEGTNLWDYEVNDEQNCNKCEMQFKIPQNQTPIITIEKYQLKTVGGFIFGIGSKNEFEVLISTNFTPNKVIRRAEDFDWLKNIMTVNHQGCFVPPLEPSRELIAEDKEGIKKRKEELQKFINNCMKYEHFHSSKYMKYFLEIDSLKKFLDVKNRQTSFQCQKDFDSIQTQNGRFKIQISDRINKTIKGSSQIANEMNTLYGDLNTTVYRILSDMENIKKNVSILGNISTKLSSRYQKLQQLLAIEHFKAPIFLESLGNILGIMEKNLKRHIGGLNEFLENYVKNEQRNWNQFIIHDKRQQSETKNYLSFKQNLIKKKEKYIGDMTKWEIPEAQLVQLKKSGVKLSKEQCLKKMFPSEQDTETRLRIWLSFVNKNYIESLKKFLILQQQQLESRFIIYSGEYECLSKQVWSALQNFRNMISS